MHDAGYTLHADLNRANGMDYFLESIASEKMVEVQRPVDVLICAHLGSSAWVTPTVVKQYRLIDDEDFLLARHAG